MRARVRDPSKGPFVSDIRKPTGAIAAVCTAIMLGGFFEGGEACLVDCASPQQLDYGLGLSGFPWQLQPL